MIRLERQKIKPTKKTLQRSLWPGPASSEEEWLLCKMLFDPGWIQGEVLRAKTNNFSGMRDINPSIKNCSD